MKNLLTITILLISLNIFASDVTSVKTISNTQPQETFRVRVIEGVNDDVSKLKYEQISNKDAPKLIEDNLLKTKTILDITISMLPGEQPMYDSSIGYNLIDSLEDTGNNNVWYNENTTACITKSKNWADNFYALHLTFAQIMYKDKGTENERIFVNQSISFVNCINIEKPVLISRKKAIVDKKIQIKDLVLIVEKIG